MNSATDIITKETESKKKRQRFQGNRRVTGTSFQNAYKGKDRWGYFQCAAFLFFLDREKKAG